MKAKKLRAAAKQPAPATTAAQCLALRVVSLQPGATDTLRALGATNLLVGRTHECDWPELKALSVVTSDRLGKMAPADLNAAMVSCRDALTTTLSWCGGGAALLHQGLSSYCTDVEELVALKPDIVLTQLQGLGPDLTPDHYLASLEHLLGYRPTVVHLAAADMEGMWAEMRAISEALRLGKEGLAKVQALQRRLGAAADSARGRPRPRVVVVRWPEPLLGGAGSGSWGSHLVALAGARNVLGRAEAEAEAEGTLLTAQQLAGARPDAFIFAMCGFNLSESRQLAAQALEQLCATVVTTTTTTAITGCGGPETAATAKAAEVAIRKARTIVMDGRRVFSRAGPGLVQSVEALVEALHGEAQAYGHEERLWTQLEPSAASHCGGSIAGTATMRI